MNQTLYGNEKGQARFLKFGIKPSKLIWNPCFYHDVNRKSKIQPKSSLGHDLSIDIANNGPDTNLR